MQHGEIYIRTFNLEVQHAEERRISGRHTHTSNIILDQYLKKQLIDTNRSHLVTQFLQVQSLLEKYIGYVIV